MDVYDEIIISRTAHAVILNEKKKQTGLHMYYVTTNITTRFKTHTNIIAN